MTAYYLILDEWNYPTESGREVLPYTYDEDEREEALKKCLALAVDEKENFMECTGEDALPVAWTPDGTILTTRSGLDGFYYAARLVKITPLDKEVK